MSVDRPTQCVRCDAKIESNWIGRPRKYCSQICRQLAYLARKANKSPATSKVAGLLVSETTPRSG